MTSNATETRWLDNEQQHAWRAYLVGTTLLMDRLDRDLREQHDISLTGVRDPRPALRVAPTAGSAWPSSQTRSATPAAG